VGFSFGGSKGTRTPYLLNAIQGQMPLFSHFFGILGVGKV